MSLLLALNSSPSIQVNAGHFNCSLFYKNTNDVGAFVLNGNSAEVLRGRLLEPTSGTYAELGNDIRALYGRFIGAVTGAYIESNIAALLIYNAMGGITSFELYTAKYAVATEIAKIKKWNELGAGIPAMAGHNGSAIATIDELNTAEAELNAQLKTLRLLLYDKYN